MGDRRRALCAAGPRCALIDSAVEDRPADIVPQPLVIEDNITNLVGELVALPEAFQAPGRGRLTWRRRIPHRSDGVGCRAKIMSGDVRHGGSLGGGVGRIARGSLEISGRGVGVTGGSPRLGHRDFAAGPGAGHLDGVTRASIVRPDRFEKMQHMLRARRRPQGQKPMIAISERATAADGDEATIANFRQDHVWEE